MESVLRLFEEIQFDPHPLPQILRGIRKKLQRLSQSLEPPFPLSCRRYNWTVRIDFHFNFVKICNQVLHNMSNDCHFSVSKKVLQLPVSPIIQTNNFQQRFMEIFITYLKKKKSFLAAIIFQIWPAWQRLYNTDLSQFIIAANASTNKSFRFMAVENIYISLSIVLLLNEGTVHLQLIFDDWK